MDDETRRSLLSSVDAAGIPKWKPATVEDLPDELREQVSGMKPGTADLSARGAKNTVGTRASTADAEIDAPWMSTPNPTGVTPGVKNTQSDSHQTSNLKNRMLTRTVGIALGIFLIAALPRLIVLFFVTDPQDAGVNFYGDVYHHWQVGYLSKEIGFSEGFLRLWDFKGLEFFWGLLHPLTLAFLFTITGSVDILIPRLLSVVAGSASLVLLFFLLRRHFNQGVAFAGLLLAAFNPVAIFSDQAGMQEPLGLFLLFLGLWLWPRNATWTGVLWALAGMVRAEYWVFAAALVVIVLITEKDSAKRIPLALGFGFPMLLYMKYMLDYTGNPIYPIYWNFMAGTAGAWIEDRPLTEEQVYVQLAARILLVLTFALSVWILMKRQKSAPFLLLGLGNILMLAIVLGLGAYIRGYVTRVLWDRLMAVPYMYVGLFLAIGMLDVIPARIKFPRLWMPFAWLVILVTLAGTQLAWVPVMDTYWSSHGNWPREKELAADIASYYAGGTILIPEDRPYLTYLLVRDHGIQASQLQGQMYDPFSYFTGDPYSDWENSRPVLEDWLARDDIRLIVFYSGKQNYEELVRRIPTMFQYRDTSYSGKLEIYASYPN